MPPEILRAATNGTLISPDYDLVEAKVQAQNSAKGELNYYDCHKCLNRGFVAHRRGDTVVTCECDCMPIRRSLRNIAKSGLTGLLDRYTFERYTTPENWQQSAKAMAQEYALNPDGKWFCAFGAVGAGKSHLCTAICVELLARGIEVRYMLWRDESVMLKATVNEAHTYSEAINRLKNVDVLYIDDLFKGKAPTPADINLAYEILNHRYAGNKATIISSELTMANFLDIDQGVGSRIYERSRGYVAEFSGQKNQRLR